MHKQMEWDISRRNFLAGIAGTGLSVLYPMQALSQDIHRKMDYEVSPIPLSDVEISDAFWSPRILTTRTVTLPYLLQHSTATGRATDGRLIEASAYFLAKNPDPVLQRQVESLFDSTIQAMRSREHVWSSKGDGSFFAAAHFFEGAVAYYQATGNRKLLDVAIEVANDLYSTFGPGKRYDISNHEGIELALVKLYRATGDYRYVTLAKFIVDVRGTRDGGRELSGFYAQDDRPIKTQTRAIGHCVRATYLYNAVADLAALTNDAGYNEASRRIWQDATSKRTYLTGGIGSYRQHENFGDDYDLPNLSCWNEICAAVGNILWNHRMFLLTQDAQYIDVMERILYNGMLAGVSLSGDRFLYQTPLKTTEAFERQPWFGPNCCPPNITRLVAQMGSLIYAVNSDNIYVNLFIGSHARSKVKDIPVVLEQQTEYPLDGKVRIKISPKEMTRFSVNVRIPGWAQNRPMPGTLYRYETAEPGNFTITVNGKQTPYTSHKGYARIEREWTAGDSIEVTYPMSIKMVRAHDLVADNKGMVALERGPLVFCAEAIDNKGSISDLIVDHRAKLTFSPTKDALNGIGKIQGTGSRSHRGEDGISVMERPDNFIAIPFYAFGNRGKSEMSVWLPSNSSKAVLHPVRTLAATSKASSSCGDGTVADNYPDHKPPTVARRMYPSSQDGSGSIRAIADQVEPINSEDGSGMYLRLRPQSGDQAWVQYDFPAEAKVSSVAVYWKDDKQFCVLPSSWRLLYKTDSTWKPVQAVNGFPINRDQYVEVRFNPVVASGLRIEIQLQKMIYKKGDLGPPDADYLKEDLAWYEGGLIEWKVNV